MIHLFKHFCSLKDIELPEDLSPEMYSLLSNLLARDVESRLGCMGRGWVCTNNEILICGPLIATKSSLDMINSVNKSTGIAFLWN